MEKNKIVFSKTILFFSFFRWSEGLLAAKRPQEALTKGGNADKFDLHVFGDIVRSGKRQKMCSSPWQEAHF